MRDFSFQFLRRTETRLAGFGLAAVAAVYLGFLGVDVEMAGTLVKRGGYYVLLLTFALWVAALARRWRGRVPGAGPDRRELLLAGALIAGFSLLAINSEPMRSKVLFDEFVLQSTAYNMHFFRDVATMVRGYDILGVFVSLDNYLDKRPGFYPFLVSLVHDLTGYRTANAYWLNAALYPATLGLAYYLGRQVAQPWGGRLAVVLLGSLPLLGQNATGSGMELLNFGMILAVVALAGSWLRAPDEDRLSALVMGGVLLAQCRYESAIYVGPVAVVILLGWWQRRAIILSWSAVAAPLLLLPCALQNKVLNNSKWMWELKEHQEARFSTDYLAKNLHDAADFLFSTTNGFANSLVLSLVGFAALGWLAWAAFRARGRWRELPADQLALLLFGLGALGNTALIMFYYWSSFADPMAARFSLPLYLVLAFAVIAAGGGLARRWPAVSGALAGVALLATVIAAGRFALPLYSHTGIDEIEWEKRYVAALPPGPRLIITNKSTLPWLLEKIPSILVGRTRLVGDRLKYQLEIGAFRDILVMQALRPTTAHGDHELVADDVLPAGFRIELLIEKRFGTKLDRISRLVAIDLPSPAPGASTTAAATNRGVGQ